VDDYCPGTAAICPDTRVLPGTVCNASQGPCDPAETCNGGVVCPANVFYDTTHVCRASINAVCDPAEVCPGGVAACPADIHTPDLTHCDALCGYCSTGSCINSNCEEFGGTKTCRAPGTGQAGCM
jgi:hypothetical protein